MLASYNYRVDTMKDKSFKYYWETTDAKRLHTEKKPSQQSSPQSGILIQAQLPGFKKEEINIRIDGNILQISAHKTEKKEQKGKNFFSHSSSSSLISRSISLPKAINPENLETSYEGGILTIALKRPKKKKRVGVK